MYRKVGDGLPHPVRYLLRKLGCGPGKGSPGYDFEVIDATGNDELRAWLAKAAGRRTVPQIFIGGSPVGGYDDIKALDRCGELEQLVRSA
jgi:glutaredoxin 3